jgi:hypothetical protein
MAATPNLSSFICFIADLLRGDYRRLELTKVVRQESRT